MTPQIPLPLHRLTPHPAPHELTNAFCEWRNADRPLWFNALGFLHAAVPHDARCTAFFSRNRPLPRLQAWTTLLASEYDNCWKIFFPQRDASESSKGTSLCRAIAS